MENTDLSTDFESKSNISDAENRTNTQFVEIDKDNTEQKVEIMEEIRKDGLNVNAHDFVLQSIVSKSVSYITTKSLMKNDELNSRYSFPENEKTTKKLSNEGQTKPEETKRFQYTYNQGFIPENSYSSDLYSNRKRDVAFQVSHSSEDLTDPGCMGFELDISSNKHWQPQPFSHIEEVQGSQVDPALMIPSIGGMTAMGTHKANMRNSFPPQGYKAAPIYSNPMMSDYFPYDGVESDEFSAMSNYNRLANVTMCSYSNSNSAYPLMMNAMQYNPNSVSSSPSRPSKVVRSSIPVDGYIYQVQFKRSHRNFILAPSAPRNIIQGDFVKVEADRGEDMGIVLSKTLSTDFEEVAPTAGYRGRGFSSGSGDKKFLFRLATPDERTSLSVKVQDEEIALAVIREKVLERCLPMVILDAEYQFDRHKLTFFFEAERRIDFRELVSELFSQYKTRIWMQQVDTSSLPIHDTGTELAQATGFLPSSHVNSNYSLVKSPYQFKHDYYGDSNDRSSSYSSPNSSPYSKNNNNTPRGYYPNNNNNNDFHFPDVNSSTYSTGFKTTHDGDLSGGIKPLFESSSLWNFG